ncbi:MAG TPA: GGDEF domain-containing protein, partial [Acidimicrobiales bacterium]
GVVGAAIREVDVPCRWGGEEFAILLQRADPRAALTVAQRVIDQVRAAPLERNGQSIRITVSAGVASFPGDGRDGAEVVARADAALLRAKANGKDRVERASSTADVTVVVDVTERESLAAPGARPGPPAPS